MFIVVQRSYHNWEPVSRQKRRRDSGGRPHTTQRRAPVVGRDEARGPYPLAPATATRKRVELRRSWAYILKDPGRPRSGARACLTQEIPNRSEEHTSELQSLMRSQYAAFCVKKN